MVAPARDRAGRGPAACIHQRKTVTAVSNIGGRTRHGTWLSDTDVRHFADHGWVVVPDAIPPVLCLRLPSEMDTAFSRVQPWQSDNGLQGVSEPHLTSTTFLDLFRVEGFIATCRQLVGHGPRLRHCIALRTNTHPRALDPDARLTDQTTWGWHRDFQPDSIIRQPGGPGANLTSQAVVAAAYLTPTTAGLGATAFLDRTHLLAGSYADLAGAAPFVQPEVDAGIVVLFSKALMHSATSVTGNGTRDAVLTDDCPMVRRRGARAVRCRPVGRPWPSRDLRGTAFRRPRAVTLSARTDPQQRGDRRIQMPCGSGNLTHPAGGPRA